LHTGRARVGVTFGDVMPYLTGGIAAAGLKAWNGTNSTNSDLPAVWGGVVGGGVEWMFLPHWSAKAEYLYVPTFGAQTSSDIFAAMVERNINLFRFGVNFHFGEEGPVTARY
jgi:outer membrane immunogenic protein